MMVRGTFSESTIMKLPFNVLALVILVSLTSCNGQGEPEGEEETHEEEHSNLIRLDPGAIKAANIRIEEVTLKSLKNSLQAPGDVHFNDNKLAHVGSRVSGRIVEVQVNLGDKVQEGDSLAIIDSTELGTAQSEYLKAKANFLAQEKSYVRAKKLLEGKAISLLKSGRRDQHEAERDEKGANAHQTTDQRGDGEAASQRQHQGRGKLDRADDVAGELLTAQRVEPEE